MVFKLFIDKSRAEEVTATVHERTALIDEIERLVLQESITDKIPGYEDDTIVMLPTDSVECFYVENDKTYAHCADKRRYLVKKRLYELEKLLPGNFEKINKSAIANWSRVSKLKVELSGVVDVVFSSGHVDCILRRCFSELRRRQASLSYIRSRISQKHLRGLFSAPYSTLTILVFILLTGGSRRTGYGCLH